MPTVAVDFGAVVLLMVLLRPRVVVVVVLDADARASMPSDPYSCTPSYSLCWVSIVIIPLTCVDTGCPLNILRTDNGHITTR